MGRSGFKVVRSERNRVQEGKLFIPAGKSLVAAGGELAWNVGQNAAGSPALEIKPGFFGSGSNC